MTAIVLVLTGVLLVVLNFNAIKKEKNSFRSALKNEERDITEYQIEIGKMRKEFAETILELQQEIERLKDKEEKNIPNDEALDKEKSNSENNTFNINDSFGNEELIELIHKGLDDDEDKNENNNKNVNNQLNNQYKADENNKESSFRVNEIKHMLDEGLNVEEIAEKVGIGKGEVLLIKDLYIK